MVGYFMNSVIKILLISIVNQETLLKEQAVIIGMQKAREEKQKGVTREISDCLIKVKLLCE